MPFYPVHSFLSGGLLKVTESPNNELSVKPSTKSKPESKGDNQVTSNPTN